MKDRTFSVLRLARPLRAWLQRFAFLSLAGAAIGLMLLALALTLFRTESREASPQPAASAQRTPASGGD